MKLVFFNYHRTYKLSWTINENANNPNRSPDYFCLFLFYETHLIKIFVYVSVLPSQLKLSWSMCFFFLYYSCVGVKWMNHCTHYKDHHICDYNKTKIYVLQTMQWQWKKHILEKSSNFKIKICAYVSI